MKHLNPPDLEALARQLDVLKRQVLDELQGIDAQVPGGKRPSDREVHSHTDDAEVVRIDDVHFAEIEVDRARLHGIEQAQQRMACGRYGLCIDCGEEIPRDRMLAQPTAIRCAACQNSAEGPRRR
ncbi:TraR/DksA C4-type zinc finger protein [Variovorax sp. J2P1-59]|uniref:TraR/DksA family transcriptional regulator n=1 Tax=Variovorax flavidus TaxID=3053501 RepID=UPI002577BD55|nr:TraR/DksA C4-type zinc finger protein [Variovorax sp. J2P1-59]MDM0078610.1 TraR/DksA C4-type zinc finger protein [Variovorax sp. J2P1-59]